MKQQLVGVAMAINIHKAHSTIPWDACAAMACLRWS
jgi:hypothetical protein